MIKRPRQHNEKHLKFIRSLPCLVCGAAPVDAAHIRFAATELGKRAVGIGERPDDIWTLPLCRKHHDLQHKGSEHNFWRAFGHDPLKIALALFAYTGQHEVGEEIVRAAR